jgi:protein phosphatase
LEELGQITSDEAALHPQRNVLYRAHGQNEPFEPDSSSFPLPRGGHIMLCSDGLWGVISAEEIAKTVTQTSNPEIACQKMVNSANAAGGPDNITVVLVRIPE